MGRMGMGMGQRCRRRRGAGSGAGSGAGRGGQGAPSGTSAPGAVTALRFTSCNKRPGRDDLRAAIMTTSSSSLQGGDDVRKAAFACPVPSGTSHLYESTSRYHTPPIFYRAKPVSRQLAATFRCFEGGSSLLSACQSRKLCSAGKNKTFGKGRGAHGLLLQVAGPIPVPAPPASDPAQLAILRHIPATTNQHANVKEGRAGRKSVSAPRLTGPRRRCVWASSFAAGSSRPSQCAGAPCHRRRQSAAARGAALPQPPRG
eukprot:COSAG04_NODE_9007_length_908_cov_1.107540_1_plen_258_part_00